MNAEIDVRSVLPSVRVPTLVIHRTGDECLKVEEGRYMASKIPGARFVELPGRDHLPFVGDQDAILDEVEEFLTGARPEHRIDRVLTTVLFVLFDDGASPAPAHHQGETTELVQSHVRLQLALSKGQESVMSDTRPFATFDGPARAMSSMSDVIATAGGDKPCPDNHHGRTAFRSCARSRSALNRNRILPVNFLKLVGR